MQAIKANQQTLIAALDKSDSVGIIDKYFPKAEFFTEFERFDRHIFRLTQSGHGPDYLSVCSPNYLHDAHIRFGIRNGADVICEKPLVLNPWNLDGLEDIEQSSGKAIFNILQLRLHPSILLLKSQIEHNPSTRKYDIDLTYITPRGNWYYTSWKADISKSGGIATNIGIHFFDMLLWLFGPVEQSVVHLHTHDRAAGFLELKHARVRWFLSINAGCLPPQSNKEGKAYRSLEINGQSIEFSEGFADLHTASYRQILAGQGFRISDTRAAIELAYAIRHAKPATLSGDYHPLAKLPFSQHPFGHPIRE
jgi:UDP-N-acetyl-2-amino-2-deoxyglucuronate dehydrogenase